MTTTSLILKIDVYAHEVRLYFILSDEHFKVHLHTINMVQGAYTLRVFISLTDVLSVVIIFAWSNNNLHLLTYSHEQLDIQKRNMEFESQVLTGQGHSYIYFYNYN